MELFTVPAVQAGLHAKWHTVAKWRFRRLFRIYGVFMGAFTVWCMPVVETETYGMKDSARLIWETKAFGTSDFARLLLLVALFLSIFMTTFYLLCIEVVQAWKSGSFWSHFSNGWNKCAAMVFCGALLSLGRELLFWSFESEILDLKAGDLRLGFIIRGFAAVCVWTYLLHYLRVDKMGGENWNGWIKGFATLCCGALLTLGS